MSTIDPETAVAAARHRLTGPGGHFELVEDDVRGTRLAVFKNRARSLTELLTASIDHGDRDYIVTADERITFRGHAEQVAALAAALRDEHGVGKGDRVAIAAANEPEWIVTFWAVISLGAIAVGCNAWWSSPEMEHGLRLTEPVLVVADAPQAALVTGSGIDVLPMERIGELVERFAGAALPNAEVAEDDPAIVLFTSGTSGRPKGAVHSHRNVCSVVEYHRMNDAFAAAMGDPIAPQDRKYLLALPLFHIACLHNLAVPRLATGSTVVLHRGGFKVDEVLSLVERERVTNWAAVPTQAHRLVEHDDLSRYDLSSLTAFALATAPSSAAFKQRLREKLPVAERTLVDSYGMTETCTALTAATPADLAELPNTLGRPIAGVELEIRDPLGTPLAESQEGEVCVRSAYNMLGYWNDPEATASTIREDGWLHTGDIGIIERGRLRLSSRRSDLIIRGGENVYPAEVEGVLAEHPEVQECAVLGAPHPDLGQEVCAVVVTAVGSPLTEDDLQDYARDQLARYKVPARWRITHEGLPRNATGKVIRTQVDPTS
ncbi:steroid-24-oyl-CoA synthetase [Saccharopolyspora tripterygii]